MTSAKLDKTRLKFRIFKFFPDETRLRSYYPAVGGTEGAGQRRKSPCLKIFALHIQRPRRWPRPAFCGIKTFCGTRSGI